MSTRQHTIPLNAITTNNGGATMKDSDRWRFPHNSNKFWWYEENGGITVYHPSGDNCFIRYGIILESIRRAIHRNAVTEKRGKGA